MKIIICFLLLLNFNVFAQITIEQCIEDAHYYGSQSQTPRSINLDCSELIKAHQDMYKYDSSLNGDIKVYGHANILYTEIYQNDELGNYVLHKHFTSGENPDLTNILAVDISPYDARTYVLNEDNGQYQVYSYPLTFGGNNVPLRKLISNEIINASNLKINEASALMFVISAQEGWVKVFNKFADPDGKREENNTNMLRSLYGINTELTAPIDITFTQNELFILDESKILVFNASDNGNVTPKRIIQGFNTNLDNSKDIEISQDGQSIVVTKINNTQLVFPLAASGNVTPN